MRFKTAPAPHLAPRTSVTQVMLQVLYALIPATIAYVWYFGWGIVINICIAVMIAVASEAAMLALRGKELRPHLLDLSAVVTAVLLAYSLPPLTPWWVTAVGASFAIVFAKHLYGGLGFNPFNPAMVGYVVLLVSFPVYMTAWMPPELLVPPAHQLGFLDTFIAITSGQLPHHLSIDAITSATPLDLVKTQLKLNHTMSEIRTNPVFGDFGGRGWEWIANWLFLGGVWLLYKGVIRWHIPVAMLGALAAMAMIFYVADPGSHGSPGFHLFSGAAMLGAFFIATDPVTAATTVKGRLIYGAGIGVLVYIIRTWGGYPDGVAFAVLLMNAAVPLIDHYTRPRVYGHADAG